jgi:ATP/maltotriose-dependent transcriptional regulator MalT
MRQRIRTIGNAEDDVDVLAELFAEDVQEWPADAWLAIDDYHYAMESTASERFVELATVRTSIQFLVTSRRRPRWASARRILYGEVEQIERESLAMDADEAAAVLDRDGANALVEQSQGWPAVIGLAALTDAASMPVDSLPTALHQYFAEEVFVAADSRTQDALTLLALAGEVDLGLAEEVLGSTAAKRTLRDGVHLGVLVADGSGRYAAHPLLREFLEAQLSTTPHAASQAARDIGNRLITHGRWDDAFQVADRFGDIALAERVLAAAMEQLLLDGRVATIGRWLHTPLVLHADSAVVALARAELAFRRAEHPRAEALAAQAAARFGRDDALLPRALTRAGQSALLASREREALNYLRQARKIAKSSSDRREAVIGLYSAASELGLPEAKKHLAELERLGDGSAETVLRLGVARLTQATRAGAIGEAIVQARVTHHVVERASDPLASTSFLHMLANALNLGAVYEEAIETIDELLAIAETYRIAMPVPHALLNRALAEHGQRSFAAAHRSLDEVTRFVPPHGDIYLDFSSSAIRGRLLLSECRYAEAARALQRPARLISSLSLRAEYLASQALASACNGAHARSTELIEEATAIFPNSVESRVLGLSALAILQGRKTDELGDAARSVWDAAVATGNYDSLVCGYRSHPALLRALLMQNDLSPSVLEVVVRAKDERLARSVGAQVRLSGRNAIDRLTPREAEVYGLVRTGLTNRAIADALVVSEATVKAHIRHIYEKLGVRTRAEALAQHLAGDGRT